MSATTGVPASITTPDTVQTSRLGTLEFHDGAPAPDTAGRLYDHLDFMRGVEAYLNSIQGASLVAIRRGFQSVGVEDNQVLIFPELMDSASLFLTANSDTVYFWTFVDLSAGPMVIDVPSMGRWLRVPGPAARDHRRGRRCRARATGRASSTRGSSSSMRRPASHRRCACG